MIRLRQHGDAADQLILAKGAAESLRVGGHFRVQLSAGGFEGIRDSRRTSASSAGDTFQRMATAVTTLAADQVDLHRLDFDAFAFEPLGGFRGRAYSFELEADNADFVAHFGLTNVSLKFKPGDQFPNDRGGDVGGPSATTADVHTRPERFLRGLFLDDLRWLFDGHALNRRQWRDDADFVAVFESRVFVVEEADVSSFTYTLTKRRTSPDSSSNRS